MQYMKEYIELSTSRCSEDVCSLTMPDTCTKLVPQKKKKFVKASISFWKARHTRIPLKN